MDSYVAPTAGITTTGELEVKRSRFITLIRRVSSEDEARDFIQATRAEYPDARHHCSAFIYAVEGANPVERSSDDGEPSGTAGQPMLDVLRGSGMLDIAAVVVRYFGGVKLGTGGLVRAYSDAVSLVLPEVPRVRRQQLTVWALAVPHAQAGRLEAELRATTARTRIEIVGVDYGAEATLRVAAADDDALLHTVASLTKGSVQPERIGASWIEVSDYTG